MKRKTSIIAKTLLVLLLFTSCAEVKAPNAITPTVREITCPQADGYELRDVGMLDDGSIIALLENKEDAKQKKIYRMNLSEETNKLIYEGEAAGSYYIIKSHPNNTYSIQFENNNAFIFDNATDQLFKTVNFGLVDGTFFSISNNGKKVIYVTEKGLCVSDLDVINGTVVYKSGEMSPYWPVISCDDDKIAFPMAESIGEATTMKKCAIYNLETKESVVFDCSATALFWPSNNDGLIACDNNSFIEFAEEGSHIWYFDLVGHENNYLNVEGQITPIGVLKQGMLYYHDPRPLTADSGYRDYKMMLWNYETGDLQELDLGYQFAGIGACSVSQSGSGFLFRATVVIDGATVKKVLLVDLG